MSESYTHVIHLMRRRSSTDGFTLTEIAIVLGIIGLIMGAIWVAAAKVYQNNRLATANQQVAFIYSNYKSLFAMHGMDQGSGTGSTCNNAAINGVKDGFFPPSMGGTACASGTTSTYPLNPWNGYVDVLSFKPAASTTAGIAILLGKLPQDACINYAFQIPNIVDIMDIAINGASVGTPPLTLATVTADCIAGSTNTVQITYKAQ